MARFSRTIYLWKWLNRTIELTARLYCFHCTNMDHLAIATDRRAFGVIQE
ncbi:MAG: hypothetical protein OJF51_004884 [Nitrospira sp.]|jgi:hypothetical protein|nr:MAG: hypothetical protein OJF51_004884 [Nitrospira sp.]